MVNCEKCKNKDICKYRENTEKVIDASQCLPIEINSPIYVEVKCRMFDDGESKQGGISWGDNNRIYTDKTTGVNKCIYPGQAQY